MPTDKPKMFESLGDVTSEVSDSTDRSARYRAEDQEGHAIHFLKRLDRASGTQEELALQLYNDPEVLRFVFRSLTIHEEFDRVAVSLHEADKGPYLVTSRKGRFVTCLGEGMKIDDLYLINHSRLLNYIEKNEEYRRRRKLATSLVGEKHQMKKLLTRIASKGDDVTREEMLAVSVMQPALKLAFIDKLFEFISNVSGNARVLVRRKRFTKKDWPVLKSHYENYRAVGHLALLASMNGPGGIEGAVADNAEYLLQSLVLPLFSGDMAMLLRFAWFIGKMGKSLLPELKRRFLEPELHEEWALAFMGLIVMGLRHGKTRGKVIKILEELPDALKNFGYDIGNFIMRLDLEGTMILALTSLVNTDKAYERSLISAKRLCFEAHRPCKLPALYTWEKQADVPEDMAFTSVMNAHFYFSEHTEIFNLCLAFTPWLARCEAEDFYHPHDYYRHVSRPWRPEDTLSLIDHDREKRGERKPVKVEPTPNRNDPCPCGSGKKYKRCCLLK